MNCVFVVETSCCTNNCSQADERKDSSVDEYEAGSSESEGEDIDSLSTKTIIG